MFMRQAKQLLACIGPALQLGTLAALVSLWLGLSGLLVVSRGNPEAFLVTTFGRFSMDDAFENLNGVTVDLWCVHSFLVLIAIAAVWYRRPDVLAVLMLGPAMASAIALPGQRWSDPNWFDVVAVCVICWLVSTVVGVAYWVLRRRKTHSTSSVKQAGPAASSDRTCSGANSDSPQ
jgi:hypothetical protein